MVFRINAQTERGVRCSPPGSDAVKEAHESKIHVQLHVAMEEDQAELIGRKIYFDFLVSAEHDHVFDES